MQPDMLYLACTRGPKSFGGLPIAAWWINLGYPYLGYMTVGNADIIHFRGYVWVIQGFLIFGVLRWLIEKDPNIFRIIQTTFDAGVNRVHWAAHGSFTSKTMTSAL